MDSIILSQDTQLIIVDPGTGSTSVISAGPPGPPGSIGSFDIVPVLDEIDTRIATHNQTTPIHANATSGRDFAALFQNGLI